MFRQSNPMLTTTKDVRKTSFDNRESENFRRIKKNSSGINAMHSPQSQIAKNNRKNSAVFRRGSMCVPGNIKIDDKENDNKKIFDLIKEKTLCFEDISLYLAEISIRDREFGQCLIKLKEKFEELVKKDRKNHEIKVDEKEEKIKKLEKDKKELSFLITNNKKKSENISTKSDMMKENILLKQKLLEQQEKITEYKKQDKKYKEFLLELKKKGIDLEQLCQDRKMKKKEKTRNKIIELGDELIPKNNENFSVQLADESIINDSAESSFNFYGKKIDDSNYIRPDSSKLKKQQKNYLQKKKDFKLNLKEVKTNYESQMIEKSQ